MIVWTLPLDDMRELAAASAASWIPEAPNATRLRVTGGTINHHGERVGATEERLALACALFRSKQNRERDKGGGQRSEATHTAILASDLLARGDGLELAGKLFRVVAMDTPEVGGEVAFWRAYLVEQG